MSPCPQAQPRHPRSPPWPLHARRLHQHTYAWASAPPEKPPLAACAAGGSRRGSTRGRGREGQNPTTGTRSQRRGTAQKAEASRYMCTWSPAPQTSEMYRRHLGRALGRETDTGAQSETEMSHRMGSGAPDRTEVTLTQLLACSQPPPQPQER